MYQIVLAFFFYSLSLMTSCETPQQTTQSDGSDFPFKVETKPKPVTNSQPVLPQTESYRERVLDTYETYWPLISLEHQHQKLPSVLSDPLPEIRAFGIERVAILLRDNEATIDELQLVVSLLRDSNERVRFAVAKLLPEIEFSGLEEFVALALADETNTDIVNAELMYFQRHPYSGSFDVIVDKLSKEPNAVAALALIELLKTHNISDERKRSLHSLVRQVRLRNNTPELLTIEAMVGTEDSRVELADFLNSQNRELQMAVAKGFAEAGYSKPLIGFAHDSDFYKLALRALQQQATIDAFKSLMQLQRPNDADWDAAVISVGQTLSTSDLLRADDMLQRSGRNALRLNLLNSVWELSASRPLPERRTIAKRTVPLLIEEGDAVGALQLLDTFGESLVDEDMLSLRFRAAIFASAWDAAADAMPSPEPWINAWLELKETNQAVADVILQQIKSRFESTLNQQQLDLLGFAPTTTESNEESNS